jgi:1-acyl-sn-glycerol-3-phosphate acyltransferase
MWRLRPIQIKIGEPLDFSRYDGLAGDRFVERSITDEIMYALMELSGQEYVDVYAAKVKEDLDKANLPPDAVDKVMPRRAADVETGRVPETRAG